MAAPPSKPLAAGVPLAASRPGWPEPLSFQLARARNPRPPRSRSRVCLPTIARPADHPRALLPLTLARANRRAHRPRPGYYSSLIKMFRN